MKTVAWFAARLINRVRAAQTLASPLAVLTAALLATGWALQAETPPQEDFVLHGPCWVALPAGPNSNRPGSPAPRAARPMRPAASARPAGPKGVAGGRPVGRRQFDETKTGSASHTSVTLRPRTAAAMTSLLS